MPNTALFVPADSSLFPLLSQTSLPAGMGDEVPSSPCAECAPPSHGKRKALSFYFTSYVCVVELFSLSLLSSRAGSSGDSFLRIASSPQSPMSWVWIELFPPVLDGRSPIPPPRLPLPCLVGGICWRALLHNLTGSLPSFTLPRLPAPVQSASFFMRRFLYASENSTSSPISHQRASLERDVLFFPLQYPLPGFGPASCLFCFPLGRWGATARCRSKSPLPLKWEGKSISPPSKGRHNQW